MPRSRRLFYVGQAIDRLSMLAGTADRWLNPEACDALANELEPLVRSLAEKVEARVPEPVLPFTLDDDSRIGEVVEFEMRDLKETLARLENRPASA